MAKKRLKRKAESRAGSRGSAFVEWLKTPTGIGAAAFAIIVVAALAYLLFSLSKNTQAQAGVSNVAPGELAKLAPAQRNNYFKSAPPMVIDTGKNYVATIATAKGNMVADLKAQDAPQTVNNFVYLSRAGFYDGLTFHRVETSPSFRLIQGGDPLGGGTGGPGYVVPAEIKLKHEAGALAMARTGDNVNPKRDSSGSQFYIGLVPLPSLDAGGYTVFGYLRPDSIKIAEQIVVGDVIQSITITEQ